MKQKIIGLSLSSFLALTGMSMQAQAIQFRGISLSQTSFVAGKTVVVSVKDAGGNDVTSQYSISYSGSELKLGAFAGKQTIQGVTAGVNYDVAIKNIATGAITDSFVSVSPGSFYKLAIVSGNNQSVLALSQPSIPLVAQAQDLYKNGIANQSVSVNEPSGPLSLTSDSQGLITIPYTAGLNSQNEVVSASSGSSSISFNEKVLANSGGIAQVQFFNSPAKVDAGSPFSIGVNLLNAGSAFVSDPYPVTVTAYSNNTCTKINTNIAPQTIINQYGAIRADLTDSVTEALYVGVAAGGHSACSSMITVQPPMGTASKIVFTQKPSSGKSGVSLFPPATIQIQDSNSRTSPFQTDLITVNAFSDSACSSALPASGNSGAAVAGKLILNSLKITQVGDAYIQASALGLSSDCIGPITLKAGSLVPPPILIPPPIASHPVITIARPSGNQQILLIGPLGNYSESVFCGAIGSGHDSCTVSPDSNGKVKLIYRYLPANAAAAKGTIRSDRLGLRSLITNNVNVDGMPAIEMTIGGSGINMTQTLTLGYDAPAPLPQISMMIQRGQDVSTASHYLVISDDLTAPATTAVAPTRPDYAYPQGMVRSGPNAMVRLASSLYPDKFLLSKDNGSTFNEITTIPSDLLAVNSYDISGKNILIDITHGISGVSTSDSLYLSQDLGSTFSEITIPDYSADGFAFNNALIDGNSILIQYQSGNISKLLLSKNLGVSFNEISIPNLGTVYSIYNISLSGNQISLAGVSGADWNTTTPYLTSSDDSGVNFTQKALPSLSGTLAFALVSGNNILVGDSMFSVYLSKDGGATYNKFALPADTVNFDSVQMK